MAGRDLLDLIGATLVAALVLSILAPVMNPITPINLLAWARLFWGASILGVVGLFLAGILAISSTLSR